MCVSRLRSVLCSAKPNLPPHTHAHAQAQWRRIINWDVFVETGVISPEDMNLLYFTDDVEAAFSHVTSRLLEWERRDAAKQRKLEEEAPSLKRSDAARAYDELLRAHRTRVTNSASQGASSGAGAL